MRGDILGPNSPRKFSSQSVWRDWFDSSPRGRSSLWVEGSIPSSLTERGAHTCIDTMSNIISISVPQHSLLTIKIGYMSSGDTHYSTTNPEFTPFSQGLLHIVTIYINYLLVSHCYSPYIIV